MTCVADDNSVTSLREYGVEAASLTRESCFFNTRKLLLEHEEAASRRLIISTCITGIVWYSSWSDLTITHNNS